MTAFPAADRPRPRRLRAVGARRSAGRPDHRARSGQRIEGPADLVQAVPYLLGFHPTDSLVLVGLRDDRLIGTARIDLPDASCPELLEHTLAALRRGGAGHVLALRFGDDVEPSGPPAPLLVAALRTAGERAGSPIADVVDVAGGRWRSLLCTDPRCCPPDGSALPETPSAFVTAAAVDGVVALADRRELERLLDPAPDEQRRRVGDQLALLARAGARPAARPAGVPREITRAALAVDAAAATPDATLDDREVARLVAQLDDRRVRDAVWLAVDHGRLDGRELWRELARRAPEPWDAAPLFLYGWASWRAGNGALANIAVQRLLAAEHPYSAAERLQEVLHLALDPRQFPPLDAPGA